MLLTSQVGNALIFSEFLFRCLFYFSLPRSFSNRCDISLSLVCTALTVKLSIIEFLVFSSVHPFIKHLQWVAEAPWQTLLIFTEAKHSPAPHGAPFSVATTNNYNQSKISLTRNLYFRKAKYFKVPLRIDEMQHSSVYSQVLLEVHLT